MKWRVMSASVRGTAHQRTGMPNQDAVDYGMSAAGDAPSTVLAVADGHGGGRHFRSQVGSTLAVHVGVKVVQEYVAGANGGKGDLVELGKKISDGWLAAVRSDLEHNPFSEAELGKLEEGDGGRSRVLVEERPELAYGATLLIAAATESGMILMQLGDGDILVVEADGTTMRPIAEDARLVGNQTTSLCQPEAWREFRTAEMSAKQGLPVLALLSTDGYVNSFRSQEDFVQIGNDYLQILREQGSEYLAEELPKILTEATQQGSGDDITLGMLHAEVIPAAAVVVKDAKASAQPGTSKSVIIRELTQEKTAQQAKLTELETNYEGVRKHVLQLRLLIGAVVLVAIAALTQQYWRPLIFAKSPKGATPVVGGETPKRGGKGGSNGDAGKGPEEGPGTKPVAGTATGDSDCVLVMAGGGDLVLPANKTVTSSDLWLDDKKTKYAQVRVQDNNLMLKNLSGDKWKVTAANGKAIDYKPGDNVPLRADTTIEFRKDFSGAVSFRSKTPAQQ